ncbi:MAG: hypothetical protein ABGX16_23810 [Pirellulales bacterium]
MNSTPPITDSPWMWLALFSAVGLSALLATGGKFGKRQSGIERRYQARDWQARDQPARDQPALDVATESGTKSGSSEDRLIDLDSVAKPVYSTPSNTLIGLWPLAGVMGAICGTSLLMLLATHRRRGRS